MMQLGRLLFSLLVPGWRLPLRVLSWLVLPIGVICARLGMISRAVYGDALPHGLSAGPAAIVALNPYLAGFGMCGLWAAVISSGPPILLGLAQLGIRDFYLQMIDPAAPDSKVLLYTRVLTAAFGVIAFFISLVLYELLQAIYWVFAVRAGIGLLLLMVTYLGVKRVTEHGAFWGLLAGLLVLIVWTAADRPFAIHEVFPAVLTVFVVALVVSARKGRQAEVPRRIIESFNLRS